MTDHVARVMDQWREQRPDLDTSPQAVIARLHRVAARLTEELVEVYAQFGLGEGEFDILATLRRQGPPYALTPSELGTQSMVSSGAITKRLDRCERQGWVSRTASPADARSRVVRLTPAGRRLIDRAFTAHIANEHRLLEALSGKERQALASALATWAELLGL
ncbi:MAG: MarR family transcriptional regulator [Nocardioides sp.]|uniref:MarR family winged helix-turn-helix transcriptional regulator n=1 Tax=Nocardioides sp. TaxID=35761 RepID=UPI0039E3182E